MPNEADGSDLDALGLRLRDPKFRRAFSQDPQQALKKAEIDEDKLPRNLVPALAELSTAELRLIGDVASILQGPLGSEDPGAGGGALHFPF